MLFAKPIPDALAVLEYDQLPDGQHYFVVSCADYDHFGALPKAADFAGRTYGLTGWNSDTGRAFYKTGVRFATISPRFK